MRLMLVGNWDRTTLEEIGSKFASGEHVAPPEPVEMIARWHDPSSRQVWLVVEAPDATSLQEWTSRWSEYLEWEIYPVMNDEEVGALLETLLE